MAPRRPDRKKRNKGASASASTTNATADQNPKPISPQVLVKAAEYQLQEGNVSDACTLAEKALEQCAPGTDDALAALGLLGQTQLELGDPDAARAYFLRAAAIDPDGSRDEAVGGGPEKFLCLAQLSEEGGRDSVQWFEKGAAALKQQIATLETTTTTTKKTPSTRTRTGTRTASGGVDDEVRLEELRRKLAMTLCSVAEVYMTDLSWEAEAEARCEALTTEATLVAPDFAETWQTLANVRISQSRADDARAALARSLELWRDLPPEDPAVPDFPSRVGLARLLMEVEMGREAIEVLERLVGEDDQSVEVWYLGGWGLYVLGSKQKEDEEKDPTKQKEGAAAREKEDDDFRTSWISSRVWLNQCLHLYALQGYEDERLGEHAKELLASIAEELGEAPAGEADEDDGEWEDEDSDEEMQQ